MTLLARSRLVAASVVAAGLLAHASADAATRTTEMVPMNDGTKLATEVVLPDGNGPWPTLFARTPYGRIQPAKDRTSLADQYGVAVVVQDTRGRFDSEGTDCVFRCDTSDGATTLAWVERQSWSNGEIVSTGGSALGIVQYMQAAAGPEALDAMWVEVATPKLYDHAMFWDGVFRQKMIEGWLKGQNSSFFLDDIEKHPTEDAFWDPVQTEDDYSRVDVPTVHWGGWYDIFSQGTIDAYRAYQHRADSGATGHQILVMGPWTHGGWGKRQKQGELTYPKNAFEGGPIKEKLRLRWLQHHLGLQDHSNWLQNYEPVHYYVMGAVGDPSAPGNRWRAAKKWPPESAAVRMYLQPEGGLAENCPPSGRQTTSYTYDPEVPTPTRGGGNLLMKAGPVDQRPIEKREDVLVFETPKLSKPMEITGRVEAHLSVSTDTVDTDLMVRMTDVYPDGRSMLVLDGALRLAARNGDESLENVEPGEIVEAVVDLWSTSIVIDEGHRLRISITSSNSPRFWPNPNDGSSYGDAASPQKAHVDLHTSSRHPSYLVVPSPDRAPSSVVTCEGPPGDAGDTGPPRDRVRDAGADTTDRASDAGTSRDAARDAGRDDATASGSDSGCGCRTSGDDGSLPASVLVLFGIVAGAGLRRSRR